MSTGNVIDLFKRASNAESYAAQPGALDVDVGVLARWPMHEIRDAACAVDSPSGVALIAAAFRCVARALVHAQYAEPGQAGPLRAMPADTALRRAVDLLDLAAEMEQRIQREQGEGA